MKKFTVSLLLMVAIAVVFCTAKPAPDSSFYFVQITDTHWGPDIHTQRLKKIVDAINALPMKIEFVAHTGDIASDDLDNMTLLSNTLSIYKQLKYPLYFVPGNHDIVKYKADKTLNIFTNYFSPLNYTVEVKGVVMLFTFLEPLRENYTITNYDPYKWVDGTLKANKNKPVIIFEHSPVIPDFYNNAYHYPYDEKETAGWQTIVNKYKNVKGIICGHFHRAEFFWIGEVPCHVAGSVAEYWERQATFRVYEYKNGKLSYFTVYIEDKK
ncbi:MAG: hypothetical protein A2Y33_03085 [Spirochaetes bacterium GWF1_51_8]|nr:MAG: hypothetical protein A2Y33_03085 [Spirochaetes bacterium GWF1_51_8]